MNNRIDIIIVNWNAGPLLRACLESVVAADIFELGIERVVVVDNGSTDESLFDVKQIHPLIEVLGNADNRGFAAACNQGAAGSAAEYLLFLNPDTRIFPDSLRQPLEFMNKSANQSVGICGIRLLDNAGRISRTCSRFPSATTFLCKATGLDILFPKICRDYIMAEWDHLQSAEVDHVIGAFYLVRRTLYERLEGFDQRFFVYLEDLDFSLRAKKAGWLTHYLSEPYAYHEGGGVSSQAKAARLAYSLRSRIMYSFKHFPRGPAIAVLVCTMLIEPICRLMRALFRFSREELIDIFHGYWILWRDLRGILAAITEVAPGFRTRA